VKGQGQVGELGIDVKMCLEETGNEDVDWVQLA
jgi:hypothetical protein